MIQRLSFLHPVLSRTGSLVTEHSWNFNNQKQCRTSTGTCIPVRAVTQTHESTWQITPMHYKASLRVSSTPPQNNNHRYSFKPPPFPFWKLITIMLPWQVFDLVSHHLDPKTLAIACCVCKSWSSCISSDHIWQPICAAHFPSLSNLKLTNPALPYYRLYAMASTAAKRRFQAPSKPSLALHHLIFTVNVFIHGNVFLCLQKPGNELVVDGSGVFKFDIDVDGYEFEGVALEAVRVTWNVVLEGWKGVFSMLECQGKRGVDWWFWAELPLPGCCSSLVDSGVVADLRLEFTDSKRGRNNCDVRRINKVTVGMLSTSKLRYVGVDDGLRYLQHFI